MPAPPPRPMAHNIPPADPVVCLATKFEFDLQRKDWIEHQTKIRVTNANKNFEAGGMRVCFEVEEIEEDGCSTPCVAKLFKKDIPDVVKVDYYNEAMAQCLSDEFAQNFNRHDTPKKISFLMCNVVKIDLSYMPKNASKNGFFSFLTQDTKELIFVMEPMFRGVFTKYNNNFGETYDIGKEGGTQSHINRRKEVYLAAETFSHFTLQESGGSMLVCDLQGVEDFFTDPQIHTEDGKGLGMGNMGEEGIQKWKEKHKCNEICRKMQLRPFDGTLLPAPAPAQPQNVGGGGGGGPPAQGAGAPPLAQQANHFQKVTQGQGGAPHNYPQFATAQVVPGQGQQQQPGGAPPVPAQQGGAGQGGNPHYNQMVQQMRTSISQRGVDVDRQRQGPAPPPRGGGPAQPNYNANQPGPNNTATQPSPNAPPAFIAPQQQQPHPQQQQQQPQMQNNGYYQPLPQQQQQYRPPPAAHQQHQQQQPRPYQPQPQQQHYGGGPPQQQPQQHHYQQQVHHHHQQQQQPSVAYQPQQQQQQPRPLPQQQMQPQQQQLHQPPPQGGQSPASPNGGNKPVNQMSEEEQLAYAMQLSKIQR